MKFTPDIAQKFTSRAQEIISRLSQKPSVSLAEFLQAIFFCPGALGRSFLRFQGIRPEDVRAIRTSSYTCSGVAFRSAIKKAALAAAQHGQPLIGTQHLLYGVLEVAEKTNDNVLKSFFQGFSLDISRLKKSLNKVLATGSILPDQEELQMISQTLQALTNQLGGSPWTDALSTRRKQLAQPSFPARKKPSLAERFGVELVEEARQGRLDPLIGRQHELERLIQVLCRRTKSNPVLIGQPGVGKTAIVQGLAQKIAQGQVPVSLLDKKIYAIRLSLLVAGTVFRGEFEARLEAVLAQAKKEKSILFIDEFHNVIGAGSASGSLDAANILKPPLASGEIQVIGATTLDEYRRFIERDKALERRLQPIVVKEQGTRETLDILKGLKKHYEAYHQIKISPSALRAATELSQKYLTDRFLPDKALDVLDEAASQLRSRQGIPGELQKIRELQKQKQTLAFQKEQEVAKGAYDKAFKIKQTEEALEIQVKSLNAALQKTQQHQAVLGVRDIKRVIASMTGVPVEKVTSAEISQLTNLESLLSQEIIGQEKAIKTLANTIRRSRAGLSPETRPLGSFIFLGPTGVGKTELTKVLARVVFGEGSLVKLDMSEFTEGHTVSRLIGAPAGYVGYGEGGELTEKVRHNPYSVVLFDEIEKAHPQIANILLQILEDGRLTDTLGNEVDFRNTIVILTSNIGTRRFTEKAAQSLGFAPPCQGSRQKSQVLSQDFRAIKIEALKELSQYMKPELLNRLDEVIVFNPLGLKEIGLILEKELKILASRLKSQNKLFLKVSPGALRLLTKKAFNPQEGGRLVRRVIQKYIEDPLASKIISGHFHKGQKVEVKEKSGKISIE